jgi:hypothetical protein
MSKYRKAAQHVVQRCRRNDRYGDDVLVIERVIRQHVEAEREACAQIAETEMREWLHDIRTMNASGEDSSVARAGHTTASDIVEAIRARGEKP